MIKNNIKFTQKAYQKSYLKDFDIVIVATNQKEINQKIALDAKSLKKLVNVVDDPKNSNFIFGANFKKGNITTSISTSGLSPVLSRIIKNKIFLSLPKNLDLFEEFINKNRDLVKETLSNLQPRRLFWQEVFEGKIASEIEEGNLQKSQNLLIEKLNKYSKNQKSAIYFIGAGPGDPELITLKAIKLLSRSDVVLYDRLISKEILNYARKDSIKINVGKTKDLHFYKQNEINNLIKKYATKGNIVARLKGGDPTIFGQLEEEIAIAKNLGVHYQIVPAVSSAVGAAAYSGIPLTARNTARGVRFLTIYKDNLEKDDYWQELAKTNDTLVFYMSRHHLDLITKNLIKFGKDKKTPIAIIEQATTKFQKTHLSNIGDFITDMTNKEFISPSLTIIGEVAKNQYPWLEENLSGKYF